MSYQFLLELSKLSAEQLRALTALGVTVQISSDQLNDEQYVRMQWLLKHKCTLNLENPLTLSEKIQWLKLYYRDPSWPGLVDKLAVRAYVEQRAGVEFLNQLYYAGDSLEGFDAASVPDSYMVKCTHGSGWNMAVGPGLQGSVEEARRWVKRWSSMNYYDQWREWVYREIPPRVVVERWIPGTTPWGLLDYKMFCFHGKVQYVQVDLDRAGDHKRNFYTRGWGEWRLPFTIQRPTSMYPGRRICAP